ncbi:MAG: YtxH domain-containing protein [Chloroflexi bacterium]|nr:YtxH domain-containing protein [Chloroflexota bacterium]
MSSDSRGWEFLTGFLLGTVVGAAAALLLAPQSGEETRDELRERSIELRNRAVETSEQTRRRAEEFAGQAQERGRLVLEEQRSRLQTAIDEGKEAAQKKRDELMARLEAEKAKHAPPPEPA